MAMAQTRQSPQIPSMHFQTSDGIITSISTAMLTNFSVLIQNMFEAFAEPRENGDGRGSRNNDPILLENVTKATLDFMTEWMIYHFENPDDEIDLMSLPFEERELAMTDWDREFIGRFDLEQLADITEVADFFSIADLRLLCSLQTIIILLEMDNDNERREMIRNIRARAAADAENEPELVEA